MRKMSQRILISAFEQADLDSAKLLLKDPDVVRNTGFREVVPDWEIPARLNNWVAQGANERGVWKVTHQVTGEFIGWTMLKDTALPYPELGYMLIQDQWGKGYATEIAATILDYGFNDIGLTRIMAGCDADNHASIRVLTKIGMIPFTHTAAFPAVAGGAYFIKECA